MINVKHFSRTCVVVIKKPKTRFFDDYNVAVTYILENLTPEEIFNVKKWEELRENYIIDERIRLSKALDPKTGILLDFKDGDKDYFYIVASSSQSRLERDKKTNLKLIDQTWERAVNFNVKSLGRVISVGINQTVKTAWTANIILDNTDDIFYLSNYIDTSEVSQKSPNIFFQENECIIESNDIVQIYLPDWNNELHLVFTGYVNSVVDANDGLEKRIRLSCGDVTKKMSKTRTNAIPSLSPKEAQGNTVTMWEEAWRELKPEVVLKYILGRAFCDVFNGVKIFNKAKNIFDTLNDPKATEKVKAFLALNQAINEVIDELTDTLKNSDGKIVGYIGRKAKRSDVSKENEIAFIILGMNQPVWTLQMRGGSPDYLISDWRSNDQIISNIAGKTFFEFYAFPSGIVFFGPTNLSLPKKYDGGEKGKDIYNSFINKNYIFNSDKDIYVRKYSQTMDDRNIFTDIVIAGQFPELGFTHPLLRKLIIAPYKYRRKFGVRMLPDETKVGLENIPSLLAYGEQRLWRQNAELYNASMFLEGNSNLQPGFPCYVDRWTSVYYISSVTHSFDSGGDYSTTLKLIYRRKPIFVVKTTPKEGSARFWGFPPAPRYVKALDSYLTSLVEKQEISKEEKEHILKYKNELAWGIIKYGDKTNMYTGNLIWESIPSNLYPDQGQVDNYSISYIKSRTSEIIKDYDQKIVVSKSISEIKVAREIRDSKLEELIVEFKGIVKDVSKDNFLSDALLKR